MIKASKFILTLFLVSFAVTVNADPIEIVALTGGEHPDTLGGYEMVPFAEPSGTSNCTASASGGEVCFADHEGNSVWLPAYDPYWWQYDGTPSPDHGNVFVVREYDWIDLILPPNTHGFSFFVGASGSGNAWIQAHDDAGNSTPEVHFSVNGVYTTGCNSLTRITIEPWAWGFGYLASNQGECASVPEPAPIALLGLALLGISLTRKIALNRQRSRAS